MCKYGKGIKQKTSQNIDSLFRFCLKINLHQLPSISQCVCYFVFVFQINWHLSVKDNRVVQVQKYEYFYHTLCSGKIEESKKFYVFF